MQRQKCPSQNNLTKFCYNTLCVNNKSPFFCSRASCKCSKAHSQCQNYSIKNAVDEIKKKISLVDQFKLSIEQHFNEIMNKMHKFYQKIVEDVDKNLKYVYLTQFQKKFYQIFGQNRGNIDSFNSKKLLEMLENIDEEMYDYNLLFSEYFQEIQQYSSKYVNQLKEKIDKFKKKINNKVQIKIDIEQMYNFDLKVQKYTKATKKRQKNKIKQALQNMQKMQKVQIQSKVNKIKKIKKNQKTQQQKVQIKIKQKQQLFYPGLLQQIQRTQKKLKQDKSNCVINNVPQKVSQQKIEQNELTYKSNQLKQPSNKVQQQKIQLYQKSSWLNQLNQPSKKVQQKSFTSPIILTQQQQQIQTILQKSSILKKRQHLLTILKFLPQKMRSIELIFKARQNFFKMRNYYYKCGHLQDTIIVVYTDKGKIFAGYTPLSFNPTPGHRLQQFVIDETLTSFVCSVIQGEKFSLVDNGRFQPYAILRNPFKIDICFTGAMLKIYSERDYKTMGEINLQYSTYFNEKYYNDHQSYLKLNGDINGQFQIIQWEVYKVQFQQKYEKRRERAIKIRNKEKDQKNQKKQSGCIVY